VATLPLRWRIFWRQTSAVDRIAAGVLLLFVVGRVARFAGGRFPGNGWLNALALVSVVYIFARLLPWLRKKLLWSLRNRLIVAYLFIAVVPIVLLLIMVALSSYLLYLQFGAHLIDDDLQTRISTITNVGHSVLDSLQNNAGEPALAKEEILSRPAMASLLRESRKRIADLHVEIHRGNSIPERAGESGSRQLVGVFEYDGQLLMEAIVSGDTPEGEQTVTVSAPVSPEMLDDLPPEFGPIQLTTMRPAGQTEKPGVVIQLEDRRFVPAGQISSRRRRLHPAAHWFDVRVNGNSVFEAIFIEPQTHRVITAPVLVFFSVRPSQINNRLFSSLGALGDPLVLALSAIGVVFLLLEAAALATGVVLTRTITDTVAELYDATQHVRQGDFAHRVRIQRRDQLGVLGESFNSMTNSITSLIDEQRAKQRLESELSIAREVQDQLFPQKFPEISGVEMAALCRAARTVSGDYYDFLALGPSRLGIALADISGKGISAALLMASLQGGLRSQAQQESSVDTADLVARLNRQLLLDTLDDRYATFFYALYDGATRRLTYTTAGHLPPLFITGDRVQRLEEGGTVIGLLEDVTYTQGCVDVEPGSLLVAFSDGLVEPENVYGEQFGMPRLTEEVLRHRGAKITRLTEEVLAAVEHWAGTQEQADDMTIVVVRWK